MRNSRHRVHGHSHLALPNILNVVAPRDRSGQVSISSDLLPTWHIPNGSSTVLTALRHVRSGCRLFEAQISATWHPISRSNTFNGPDSPAPPQILTVDSSRSLSSPDTGQRQRSGWGFTFSPVTARLEHAWLHRTGKGNVGTYEP